LFYTEWVKRGNYKEFMKKSYSTFTVDNLKELGLSISSRTLFEQYPLIEPSDWLKQTFTYNEGFPISSEKARSELLIMPVLIEIKQRSSNQVTIFSGYQFDVDKKRGLSGFCDYLISNKDNAVFVESPIVAIAEVKKDQDLIEASPQCISEMYAAQLYNDKYNTVVPCIYGAVTTGYEWLFMKLQDSNVYIDTNRYHIKQLKELLGIWRCIIDQEMALLQKP
jgi:hypothetical protein